VQNSGSKNQWGTLGGTLTNSRIGSGARINIHHLPGGLSRRAHSNTESGNQKGEAVARSIDMLYLQEK